MMSNEWEWAIAPNEQQHQQRIALIREISYEMTDLIGEEDLVNQAQRIGKQGKALSLNISSGGMLLLMESAPEVDRVFRVHVPTPITKAKTPTLAEVRWVREVPFLVHNSLYFVGLKFLF
ncbi:MAG: PilZ domain-containing protein [Nitrospirae bacterium]|nr:PilZ domain-containing protein [Nitrospirota bacterium]